MESSSKPIARFLEIYARAREHDPGDPSRVALATADRQARPSVRMVLLRGVDEHGFMFFTNYGSRKAAELDANPRGALCFHWESIREQVRVEGVVERAAAEESDAYFTSRKRGSQLAAWASRQSAELASRAALLAGYLELKVRFAGRPIPRPEFWGGYRLVPDRMEFWTHRPHRMHDRLAYVHTDGAWEKHRLYP